MLNGKIILKGKIKLKSPLKIGSNKNENTDTDILKDSNGNPFIPATSFLGVIRHHTKDISGYDIETVWGNANNEKGKQIKNRIYCSDLLLTQSENNIVEIRDGIKIDNKTGLVKKGAKYNFEVVKKGLEFSLNLELDILDLEQDKRFIATVINEIEKGNIRFGSKTNSGFGEIEFLDKEIYIFDFKNKSEKFNWLKYLNGEYKQTLNINSDPFEIKRDVFSIHATFSLKNSVLIKSYSADPEMPDSVHLKSDGENIISGTSLKGAIRSRAEKIVKTFCEDKITDDLFGNVTEEKKGISSDKNRAKKGKVQVNEVVLPKFMSQMQTRIKINRFTGGTIDGALFETMPVFNDFKEKVKDVTISINDFDEAQAGLLLLVLKDLWTGDIAIGGDKGVGRGTLQGESAVITWNNNQVILQKDIDKTSDSNKQLLENFVKKFVDKVGA